MRNEMNGPKSSSNHNSAVRKAAKTAGSALLAGCLIASLGLNIYQADRSNAQNQKVNKFIDNQLERQAEEEEKENTYQEDGYVIGGEYEIRSTTHISDAYKNGDSSSLEDEDKKTLQMASDILKKIIKDGMNDYEKERAVYNWMYKNIGQGSSSVVTLPGENSHAYTPYSVLSGRNAVCVGYATTFRLFMNMLDMDCHIVHNDYHSWDMVQLDDHEWYQVDVYSDVSSKSQYRNFNMTDDISRNSHDWDSSSLPTAKGVKYTCAVQYSKELKDIYEVPAKVKKLLEKEKTYAYFKFQTTLKRDELPIADLLLNQMNMALSSKPEFESYTINGSWYQDEEDQYILGLFIYNYNDTDEPATFDANSQEGKRITKAVSEAFEIDEQSIESESHNIEEPLNVNEDYSFEADVTAVSATEVL